MKQKHSIMYLKLLLLLTLFCHVLNEPVKAQSTPTKSYVKIIVEGVSDHVDEQTIDQFIRSKSGVEMSRMDYHRQLYFAIYDPSILNGADFMSWITGLGFVVKCHVQGPYDSANLLPLKAEDCNIVIQNATQNN